MNTYCFIHCMGNQPVPEAGKWKNNIGGAINRLYYITKGEGGYFLDGKQYTFKKNHLYIIPAYANIPTWSSYENEESRLHHIFVNFELIPPIITKEVIELDPHKDPILSSTFNTLCQLIESFQYKLNSIKDDELRYLKASVIYIVNKMITEAGVKRLDDKIVISALEKIHKGISGDVSIKELAEQSFMSYYGFIRRFKNALKMTPYTYLKQLRIRTASALRDEGTTLEETAEKCGYSDAAALLHAISNEKRLQKIK